MVTAAAASMSSAGPSYLLTQIRVAAAWAAGITRVSSTREYMKTLAARPRLARDTYIFMTTLLCFLVPGARTPPVQTPRCRTQFTSIRYLCQVRVFTHV
jgi:hypothetical protein